MAKISFIHAMKMNSGISAAQISCGMAFALLKQRVTGSTEKLTDALFSQNNNN
jgi:hypothetical protein